MKRSKVVMVTLTSMALGLTGCGRKSHGPGSLDIIPPEKLSSSMRQTLPAYTPGSDISSEKPPLNAYDPHLGYYHVPCSQWFPYPHDYYDHRWGYYRCGKWSRYNSTRTYYHSSNGLTSVGHLSSGLLRTGAEVVGAGMANGPQQFSSNRSGGVSGSFGGPSSGALPPPLPDVPGGTGSATPPPLPPDTEGGPDGKNGNAVANPARTFTSGTNKYSSGPVGNTLGGTAGGSPPPLPDYDSQPTTAPKHSGVAHAAATSTRSSSINRGGFGSTGRSSGFFGSSSS